MDEIKHCLSIADIESRLIMEIVDDTLDMREALIKSVMLISIHLNERGLSSS